MKVFVDGIEYGLLDGATVQHILDMLKPPADQYHQIKVNGDLATPETLLHEGDQVQTVDLDALIENLKKQRRIA